MRILKRLFLLAGLAGILLIIQHEVFNSEAMRTQEIKIDGASADTAARIQNTLRPAIGVPLWKVPVDEAASRIKNDPWVDAVDVTRSYPNTLEVSVRERRPFAIVGSGEGLFRYVDDASNIIDRAPVTSTAQYPLLIGRDFENDSNLRTNAIALLKSLPSEGLVSRSDISDLQYDDEHGFRMTLEKSGIVVQIGKENLPLHLDRARRVVQYLNDHGINATRVDSDYAKKVLVKVHKNQ